MRRTIISESEVTRLFKNIRLQATRYILYVDKLKKITLKHLNTLNS